MLIAPPSRILLFRSDWSPAGRISPCLRPSLDRVTREKESHSHPCGILQTGFLNFPPDEDNILEEITLESHLLTFWCVDRQYYLPLPVELEGS
jgi:hypothetical protein